MSGIYIASKTRHADVWRAFRTAGYPIISTWIDEAGEGESADLNDLWERCIRESSSCSALIVYREPEDVLKGAWVEMGAALAVGIPVLAVGLKGFTIANYKPIQHFGHINAAFLAALPMCATPREMGRIASGMLEPPGKREHQHDNEDDADCSARAIPIAVPAP